MASIKTKMTITITDDQSKEKKFTITNTVSSLTALEERDYAITADQTRAIWDPTNVTTEVMTTFGFLLMWADGNVDVEFTINEGDVNEELVSIRLVKDIPFMLGADDAFFNHSASNVWGGTIDVIDKIRVKEPGSVARKLKVIMAT